MATAEYEVWQTGSEARLWTGGGIKAASRELSRRLMLFRRSGHDNAGSLVSFEIRRTDGEELSDRERDTIEQIIRR